MATLLERIIGQLDTLAPYLSLSHKDVFDLVAEEYDSWSDGNPPAPFPSNFDAFKTQVAHSAFVLGYSYADAFLSDLMREIYFAHPNMLPDKKKLSFESIIESNDYSDVINRMVDHESMMRCTAASRIFRNTTVKNSRLAGSKMTQKNWQRRH